MAGQILLLKTERESRAFSGGHGLIAAKTAHFYLLACILWVPAQHLSNFHYLCFIWAFWAICYLYFTIVLRISPTSEG